MGVYTIVALSLGSTPVAAQDSFAQFKGALEWTKTPVINEIQDARIAAAAHDFHGYPIPRAAFYDLALPNDSSEYAAMNGFGLLALTVIVRDSVDVMPQQVFLLADGHRYPLNMVGAVASPTDSASVQTFGPWRSDALYLIPVAQLPANLVVDFPGRTGFFVATLENDHADAATGSSPDVADRLPRRAAVDSFLHREYPGLFWLWPDR
jgi:hypothetical protein